MDQQPRIPTLKDAQKPQMKIKGMGATTLFERLKQFKKKDLAFILAGLGTLFMAPLAEHFMMAPENGDASLQQGWGGGRGARDNLFGSGGSPYENGNNGIAAGGAIGGGGDIITPLNVRDPSALVMGPGAAQQPPAGSAAPPTAPSRSETDYKDALAGAASRAASEALKKAPLPVPKVALGGSGLRGLGVASGGTSATGGMAPPAALGGSQPNAGGGGLNMVRPAPGFQGAAGPRGRSNPSGLDATKRAAANAGDAFSNTGSALSALNEAAKEQIPTGGESLGGGGQGGAGTADKAPGGNGAGGSKSVGESLAFIQAKERMMENLKLEFEKKRLKDPELLLYGIRNDLVKSMATEIGKELTKSVIGWMNYSKEVDETIECGDLLTKRPRKSVANCTEKETDWVNCVREVRPGVVVYYKDPRISAGCKVETAEGTTGPGNADKAPSTAGDVMAGNPTGAGVTAAADLKGFCDLLDKEIVEQTKCASANAICDSKLKAAVALQKEVGKLVSKRDALYGTSTANSCNAEALRADKSVYEYQGTAVAELLESDAGVPALIKAATDPKGVVDDGKIKAARENYVKAMELLQKVDNKTVDETPFSTNEFVDGSGVFQQLIANAKAAKSGIDKYAVDERKLLEKDINPLILGAELAGLKQGTPTVPEVVKVNSAYDAMAQRATAVGVKPGEGVSPKEPEKTNSSAVKPNPEVEAQAVLTAVDAARQAVGKSPTEGALAAVTKIENAKKQDLKYEPTAEDKQPITDAWNAWGDMQKKQLQVLSDINGGLTELKTGAKPPAAAANPTAPVSAQNLTDGERDLAAYRQLQFEKERDATSLKGSSNE